MQENVLCCWQQASVEQKSGFWNLKKSVLKGRSSQDCTYSSWLSGCFFESSNHQADPTHLGRTMFRRTAKVCGLTLLEKIIM